MVFKLLTQIRCENSWTYLNQNKQFDIITRFIKNQGKNVLTLSKKITLILHNSL